MKQRDCQNDLSSRPRVSRSSHSRNWLRNKTVFTLSQIPWLTQFTYLKTLDTIGYCQRPLFSLGVSQHIQKITNLCKFELNWSSELRDNYERKKHPCHTKLCAFICMPDFETSSSKLEVSKSNSWKITSLSKTKTLQREPFLTMFYTINLSPLLVTKWGLMLIIILSNYQVSTAFKVRVKFPPARRIDKYTCK